MKKVILVLSSTALALTVFFASANTNQSEGSDLANLVKLNSANAECDWGMFNDGHCTLNGNCYWDPDANDCAPYW